MYEKLMQNLGFPDSKYLRKILGYLMDKEEVEVAVSLPGEIEELAERVGMSKEKVRKILERLFAKGVVFPKDFSKREYFRFARDIIQLHDATMASQKMNDPEFARLWKEFGEKECNERIGQFLAATGMKVGRVVPAYRSIAKNPDILPHENIKYMIQSQEKIAVVPCSCRNVSLLAGDGCNYTDERETWHCIQLGRGGRIRNCKEIGKRDFHRGGS